MAERKGKYFKKFGFSGLSAVGKIGFLMIFAGAAWMIWQGWVRSDWPQWQTQSLTEATPEYAIGIAKVIGVGLVAAYAASIILPKKLYRRKDFYCASCGAFIGFQIERCPSCRSNKYTTDPELAAIRAEKKNSG